MALKRYGIFDKTSDMLTPSGQILSAEQWMDRYPVARVLTTVCGAQPYTGSYFGVLEADVNRYAQMGCDFSGCTTDVEKLEAIEAFEDAKEEEARNYVSDQTRTADALQDLVVLTELAQQS